MIGRYIAPLASRFSFTKKIYEEIRLRRDVKQAFNKFDIKSNKPFLYKKIKEARKYCDWSLDEFFYYDYPSLSKEEVASFISEKEYANIVHLLNEKYAFDVLGDKWKTYQIFNPFFKREAYVLKSIDSFKFSNRDIIIKPLNGSFGNGIQIFRADEGEGSIKKRLSILLKAYPDGFIVEEVIKQDDRMGVLHPESVNTLRIHTICFDGKVSVFHPYIRIGRGSSIVDNAGGGGVFTACDTETGEVINIADESGHEFKNHPDNGFPLLGYKVPCWKEAFETARKLALHDSNIHLAGWDLALTDKGWVLVEGNPRPQLIFQISEKKGFRSELKSILQEYNIDYKGTSLV